MRLFAHIINGITMLLLAIPVSFAVASQPEPLSPELAAKKENFRRQQDQKITHEKRKTAANALKAERRKIYNAHQQHTVAPPTAIEFK